LHCRTLFLERLWIASLVSGICVSAHNTAATWTMNMLAPSPLLIPLMSTAASLPFFLFTFLSVHVAGRGLGGHGRLQEVTLRNQSLVGGRSRQLSDSSLASSHQSWPHSDLGISHGNRLRL